MQLIIFFMSIMLAFTCMQAQTDAIRLSFSAKHKGINLDIDSILLENLSLNRSRVIYDYSVLLTPTSINIVGGEYNDNYASQIYPNPFREKTNIDVYVSEKDEYSLVAYDITGRKMASYEIILEQGNHKFTFFACNQQYYILSVNSKKFKQQWLMIQIGKGSRSSAKIAYSGTFIQPKKQKLKSGTDFNYEPGDELRFTGYVTSNFDNVVYDVIYDAPTSDADYVFDIAFSLFTLTINADPESGGTINGDGVYEESQEVNIEAIANDGYEFVNWTGDIEHIDDTNSASATVTLPAEDAILTANFEKLTYTIKYNLDGGDNHEENPDDFTVEDLPITLNDAYKDGHSFDGWFTEKTLDNAVIEITKTEDLELWAKLDYILPMVTFIEDDGIDRHGILVSSNVANPYRGGFYTRLRHVFASKEERFVLAPIAGQNYLTEQINAYILEMYHSQLIEVAGHGLNHIRINTPGYSIEEEFGESLFIWEELGLQVENLVYPFGEYNEDIIEYVSKKYRSGVKVGGGMNELPLEIYSLSRNSLDTHNESQIEQWIKWVDLAEQEGGWLIFMIHSYIDKWTNYSGVWDKSTGEITSPGEIDYPEEWILPLGVTPDEWRPQKDTRLYDLWLLIEYIQSKNIPIRTLSEGLDVLEKNNKL